MRPNPSALPPLIAILSAVVLFLASSCHPFDLDIEPLPPTATITLDFSDSNTRHDGTGGFRYLYRDSSYLATYHAWEAWSCLTGPDFFAAWDDGSRTVWLAHCDLVPNLESLTTKTSDGIPHPAISWLPVPEAHEPTYRFTLDSINYADIDAGTTTIVLSFSHE